MRNWLHQQFSAATRDESVPLQIRLHRLFCATTAVLCLGVILPMNLAQNLPLVVHLANIALGVFGGVCYWQSLHGRNYCGLFFGFFLVCLNPVWFFNAGSAGSLPYFFFPLLLYPLVVFSGRTRRLTVLLLVVNLVGLLLLEHFFPSWLRPFPTPRDRMIDLVSGALASCAGLVVIARMILAVYERERVHLSEVAERLAVSERNYRTIFNATSDALVILDEAGRIVDVNKPMCEMFGYERSAALGMQLADLCSEVSAESTRHALEMLKGAPTEIDPLFRWRSRRRDGSFFWSEVALRFSEIGGQRRFITSIRDISRRAAAEEALRLEEERLRLALEASNQGWFDLNVQTGEGRASAEYARLIGADAKELSVSVGEWLGGVHPEDRALVERTFRECIQTKQTRTLEYRRKTRSGEWKWIRSIGKIVESDADGRARRMLGTHTDVTDRKELEEKLRHAQRLESVATLAGGVAHDLNNILTPMLMAAGVFREKLTADSDREMMAGLESGARRGAAIVRQLLEFSRSLAAERVPIDPATLLRETAQWVRSTFPPTVSVVERIDPAVASVAAGANELRQVLRELCTNAREAMPMGGVLTLAAANTDFDERVSSRNPWGKSGAFVVISVQDTGRGISADVTSRVFDPFFTTKRTGEGSGLGLSAAHGIIRGFGGDIVVESRPGEGARFSVYLPVGRPPAA